MADYSQVNDYSEKDALSTGDPLKLIKGSDVDADFAAISSAIASKFDSTDIATAGEAQAGVDNTKVITPARLTAWGQNAAGLIEDLQALADPDADRGLMWDDSAGGLVFMTFSTGLTLTGTTLTVNEADFARIVTAGNGLTGGGSLAADITLDLDYFGLTGAVIGAPGDLISFGDESDLDTVRKATFAELEAALTVANMIGGVDPSTVTLTAGTGLSYSVGGTDMTADATIDLDLNELTTETTIDAANDQIVFYDASAAVERKVNIDAVVGTELGDGKWSKSTTTSLSTTEATVVFNTADNDSLTLGTFDTGTGLYTAGSGGARVLVTATMNVPSVSSDHAAILRVQKDGVDQATSSSRRNTIGDNVETVTTIVNLAASGVLRVRAGMVAGTATSGSGIAGMHISIVELG